MVGLVLGLRRFLWFGQESRIEVEVAYFSCKFEAVFVVAWGLKGGFIEAFAFLDVYSYFYFCH